MVAQLCSDYDNNYAEVNKHLDKMGYNIGMRLVEDFFAKSGIPRCNNLRDTADTISRVGFDFHNYLESIQPFCRERMHEFVADC